MNLSIRDAASLLNVSEDEVYEWARKGEIPFTRVNDQFRFDKLELLDWATTRRMPVSEALLMETEGEMPSLSDSLSLGGVFHDVGGTDVPTVLRAVVDLLRLPGNINREYLYQMMLAREAGTSTAVGGGIAVPHTRTPIVLRIGRPTVTLCFLATPADFKAPDGLPVHTLFTVVGATVRVHLHLLSRVAYCLHNKEVRALIDAKASEEELMTAIRVLEDSITAKGAKS